MPVVHRACLGAAGVLALLGFAEVVTAEAPRLALIVDDLGEQALASRRALQLPPEVALSFLPAGALTPELARTAAQRGHEVLLHLPLEPVNGALAPAGHLRADDSPESISRGVHAALARVPGAAGVNHHQGSRFTSSGPAVDALMRALRTLPGLYYIDSRTTPATRAEESALRHGIPALRRHVFLDAHRGDEAVRSGFRRWLAHADRHGAALAIGHPYPETLALLEAKLPMLTARGYRLVPPSALLGGAEAPATTRTVSAPATSSILPASPLPTP